MHEAIRSVDGVCEVEYLRGSDADPAAPPDLLLEVPHGATRARHFVDLWGRLVGDVATDLIDFFFVNTDVGAPELARAIAAAVVDARPQRSAVVVRSLLPRTLVDCNRSLAADVAPATSEPGQLTPGLPVWIRDPKDQQLLLRLHGEYVRTAAAAFEWVCGAGGQALMVHTYAPRNLDVAVDERIVEQLRAAYAPGRVEQWSLRPEIDLITHDPDGVGLAAARLVGLVAAEVGAAGREVAHNATYSLHPSTLAHGFSVRYPDSCLCFEVRRDLLVRDFVPFRELEVEDDKVGEIAAPFARALVAPPA